MADNQTTQMGNGTQMGNLTQPANATNVADNNTLINAINAAMTYDGEPKGLIIMSGVLLGLFFGFGVTMIVIDMRKKYRSGELRDDMQGLKKCVLLILMAFPMLFVALCAKIASFIPKKRTEPSEVDLEAAAEKTRDSQAVIERLAAKPNTTISIASFGSNFETSD